MEIILITTAATQIALYLIERHGTRLLPALQNLAPPPLRQSPPSPPQPSIEQDSIAALEQQLKSLRAEAKQLTSPDSFVAYARITREANKVEKQLQEKRAFSTLRTYDNVTKALHPQDPLATLDVTRLLSSLLTSNATRTMQRSATAFALKTGLRILTILFLWLYFSRYGRRDTVMTIDCRAIRPLSFLFRQHIPLCVEGDWQCAASVRPTCGIPYAFAGLLAQVAAGVVRQMWKL